MFNRSIIFTLILPLWGGCFGGGASSCGG